MSGAVGQQFEAAQSKVLLQPPGDAPAAPAPGPTRTAKADAPVRGPGRPWPVRPRDRRGPG